MTFVNKGNLETRFQGSTVSRYHSINYLMAGIFEGLNFLVINPATSDDKAVASIETKLRENGCEKIYSYINDSSLNGENMRNWFISHYSTKNIHFIVSDSDDFPFYKVAAFDFLIPVIQTSWVTQSIANKRHIRTGSFSPDRRHVLKDTQIFISQGCCKLAAERIFYTEIINALGGTCVDTINTRTTHLVAPNKDDKFINLVKEKLPANTNMKFVYPAWIADCFKNCTNVSTVRHEIDMNEEDADNEILQTVWDGVLEKPFVDFEKESNKFLKGRTFVLGLDLALSLPLYELLQQILQNYGAEIYHHLNETDIINQSTLFDTFLGFSAKSKEYDLLTSTSAKLKREGKSIGNLIWLFTMWSQNEFIPCEYNKGKIIFTPFSSKVFNKNSKIITFTNYFGQQRTYLQKLINLMGGITTTQLSNKNTHLISQFPAGKKYEAATKWGNCVVANHLWLETCYKMNADIDPHKLEFQRYDIIRKTMKYNLGQMTTTPDDATEDDAIDESMMHTQESSQMTWDNNVNKGDTPKEPLNDDAHNALLEDKKKIMIPKNKIFTRTATEETANSTNETFFEASDTIDTSMMGKRILKTNKYETDTTDPTISKSSELTAISSVKDDKTNFATRTISKLGVSRQSSNLALPIMKDAVSAKETIHIKKSESTKELKSSRELSPTNESLSSEDISLTKEPSDLNPVTGGSRRAAAVQAAKRLHSDMESLNEFQKSKKSKSGKVAMLPQEKEQLKENKEMMNEAKELLEKCNYYIEENGKTLRRHIFNMYCIATGCDFDQISGLDKAILDIMGITLLPDDSSGQEDIINCLIAPKKLRTSKFLKGLAFPNLKYAVKPNFIIDLLKNINAREPFDWNEFIQTDNFIIPDVSRELLNRAHKNKKMFERARIYNVNLVRDIKGGPVLISSILKEHGIRNVNILDNNSISQFEKFQVNQDDESNNHNLRKVKLENGNHAKPPKYVLIVSKPAQMRKFRDTVIKHDSAYEEAGMWVVNWEWCVNSIFKLDIDYRKDKNVLLDMITKD